MFAGLQIPFAVEINRGNPLRMPVRNLAIAQGDDVTLAVQVYDNDGTALDLTDNTLTAKVLICGDQVDGWGLYSGTDYGLGWDTYPYRALWTASGTVPDPAAGLGYVIIPRDTTAAWRGRYELVLSLDATYGGCQIARGILNVRPGPVSVAPRAAFVPLTDESGVAITDGTGTPILVPAPIGLPAAPALFTLGHSALGTVPLAH